MFKSLGLLHNLEAFIIGPSTTTERILGRRGARVYRIASNVRYTTETAIEYQLAAAVLRIVNSKFSSTFCLPRIQHVLLSASSIGCQSLNELHFLYEKHPEFSMFPSYPSVLPFKRASNEVTDSSSTQEMAKLPGVPETSISACCGWLAITADI